MQTSTQPGSHGPLSYSLERERTPVEAGHETPKIWETKRMRHMGGVVKCKIVAVVRKTQNVLEGFEIYSVIRTSL